MVFMCKLGQNPSIRSGDRVQTRLIFTIFIVWWPWKLGQGHQNLINSFNYPSETIHKVWPESIIWFKRQSADKLFVVKIGHSKCWCDLENKVKVAKLKTFPPMSQCFFFVQDWSKSTNWFRRESTDKAAFYSLYTVVTLKIRSRSPKAD